MSDTVLIRGGTVLSLDRSVGNSAGTDVLIENGLITEVGSSLRGRGAEVIDASAAIVMPGFVDSHRHAWHSLFRNSGRGPAPMGPADFGPHHTADHVYAATLSGLLGAAASGITTVVDWADLPPTPAHAEAAIQAHTDAGLRSVFVVAAAEWATDDRGGDALRALASIEHGPDVEVAYGARTPVDDSVAEDWAAARRSGLRIHVRVGRDAATAGLVSRLGESGLLDDGVTLVHCTNLSDEDFDAIASSGARVAIAPALEMTSGMGVPPMQALLDRSIRFGLGVGSELEASGDMFAPMRAANSIQHATLFDLKLAGKGGVPNLLTTREVIRSATIDGAAAAGLEDVTGSLTPGRKADVVILRTDLPNIAPVNDPIGAVVWGMDGSNVDWVLVGGRALVRHGEPVADVQSVGARASEARHAVAESARLVAGAEPR